MRLSRSRAGLVTIVALAVVLRVALVLATPGYRPADDASDFDRIAVSLASRGGFPTSVLTAHGGPTAFRPPMFPVVLSVVYRFTGVADAATRWEAGRLLEALLGGVAVLLIWLLARRLFGSRVAVVAGGLATVYPPLVLVGSSLLSESLFIPVALGAVLCALRFREDPSRWRSGIGAGVLVTVGALTRTNGAILIVPLAFLVWTGRPRLSRAALRAPVIVALSSAIALGPWTVRNAHVFHALVPTTTQSGYGLAGTYNPIVQGRTDYPAFWAPPVLALVHIYEQHPAWDEAQVSSALDTEGFDYIGAHPLSLVKTAYWNFVRLFNLGGAGMESWAAKYESYPRWLADLSVYAFWVVALVALGGLALGLVLGLVLGRRGGALALARRAPAALWWCPALLVLSAMLFIGDTRYRSPADPFILLLAALALVPRAVDGAA